MAFHNAMSSYALSTLAELSSLSSSRKFLFLLHILAQLFSRCGLSVCAPLQKWYVEILLPSVMGVLGDEAFGR